MEKQLKLKLIPRNLKDISKALAITKVLQNGGVKSKLKVCAS